MHDDLHALVLILHAVSHDDGLSFEPMGVHWMDEDEAGGGGFGGGFGGGSHLEGGGKGGRGGRISELQQM
jgi:hypothetical protein